MATIRTQNGIEVVKGDHIAVSHNDFWNKASSNFGSYFVGKVNVGAASYDAQHDPIVWLPKNNFTPGCEAHKQRDTELQEMAELIANAFREEIAAR